MYMPMLQHKLKPYLATWFPNILKKKFSVYSYKKIQLIVVPKPYSGGS